MYTIKNIFLSITDSTQNWVKKNIKSLREDLLTCVIAKKQTQGKGRFNNQWISPTGNLYCSFYFIIKKPTNILNFITLITSYSLAILLRKKHLNSYIKWPNDIVINNKKIAGILCESIEEKDNIKIILGIGVNINMTEKKEITTPFTSLYLETKKTHNILNFLINLQKIFLINLHTFLSTNYFFFKTEFNNLLLYKGLKITFFYNNKKYEGIKHSISYDGGLNMYLSNEKVLINFTSGYLIHTIRSQ